MSQVMPPQPPRDPSDEVDEPPPLDPSEFDESEGPAVEEATELVDLTEEGLALDEDEAAPDVELGIEVEEHEAAGEEHGETVLDIASLLAFADEREETELGDDDGQAELEMGVVFDAEERGLVGSTEEGTDEPFEELVNEELPELDEDEPTTAEQEAQWLEGVAFRDEELPERGAAQWSVEREAAAGSELTCVGVTERWVVAAGVQVARVRPNGEIHLQRIGGLRVTSLAIAADAVLCATGLGELARVELGSERPEWLPSQRSALGAAAGETLTPEIVPLPAEPGPALALHARTARLLSSRDAGQTWEGTELGGRIVAASRSGGPLRLLTHGDEGYALVTVGPGAWQRVTADALAEEIAASDGPLLASSGKLVALASPSQGLAVSLDDGCSFRRVSGCVGASALCTASVDGAPRLWVATFREADETAFLVEIDPATAQARTVAEVVGVDDPSLVELAPRIFELAWDPARRCLWAASEVGLLRFDAPAG